MGSNTADSYSESVVPPAIAVCRTCFVSPEAEFESVFQMFQSKTFEHRSSARSRKGKCDARVFKRTQAFIGVNVRGALIDPKGSMPGYEMLIMGRRSAILTRKPRPHPRTLREPSSIAYKRPRTDSKPFQRLWSRKSGVKSRGNEAGYSRNCRSSEILSSPETMYQLFNLVRRVTYSSPLLFILQE